jgi:DNA topoisomerase VI subunit B
MQEQYEPKANVAKELLEISKDFTHPRELIRETISNSIDASASEIWIEALEDDSRGEKELVIRVIDNGTGMDKETLKGFFDLGFSKKTNKETAIGQKGHGTKITYNSSRVTVYTRFIDSPNPNEIWCATMDDPKRQLNLAIKNNTKPPSVKLEQVATSPIARFEKMDSGTLVEVRGYDNDNKNNLGAFAHGPLEDYIQWFTAWGRIDVAWGGKPNPPCKLFL